MRKLGVVVALVALTAVSPLSAQSVICSFSGSGTSGTDCLGQSWSVVNNSGTLADGWGIPGIVLGTRTFAGAEIARDFHITFNASGSFSGLIGSAANGYDTRFQVSPFGTTHFWTPVISGNTIDFTATAGDELNPGQAFFVNVAFLGGAPTSLNDVSFTASWTRSPTVVPEPASVTLMAAGLLGVAGFIRQRRKS